MEYYKGGNRQTNKSGSRLPTKFVINKSNITSEIGIANEFNKFLQTLVQNWPKKNQLHREHLRAYTTIQLIQQYQQIQLLLMNLKKPCFP